MTSKERIEKAIEIYNDTHSRKVTITKWEAVEEPNYVDVRLRKDGEHGDWHWAFNWTWLDPDVFKGLPYVDKLSFQGWETDDIKVVSKILHCLNNTI